VTDEDLAVGLYVVMRNSFAVRDDARLQWTCPVACFAGMFRVLRRAGLTRRGGGKRNKVVAVKRILERAGLIECLDRRRRKGVGHKYTIGPNHWRYGEFVRFSQGVRVRYVRDEGAAAQVEESFLR
jgi:hypothetical protein